MTKKREKKRVFRIQRVTFVCLVLLLTCYMTLLKDEYSSCRNKSKKYNSLFVIHSLSLEQERAVLYHFLKLNMNNFFPLLKLAFKADEICILMRRFSKLKLVLQQCFVFWYFMCIFIVIYCYTFVFVFCFFLFLANNLFSLFCKHVQNFSPQFLREC